MIYRRGWLLVVLEIGVLTPVLAQTSTPGRPVVLVRLADEPITPATVRFLDRAMRQAKSQAAQCLVIELDTPGGLLDSTRHVVKQILASQVPVVVYVAPSGSRAASAGVFITMAAHVAAMAPGTHIGAAHPVQIGGLPTGRPNVPRPDQQLAAPSDQPAGQESKPDAPSRDVSKPPPGGAMEEKLVNDARAWIRSLAQLRDRNADWAVLAVSESRSLTDSEALSKKVVDLVATDLNDLLAQIDGRSIPLAIGSAELHTRGAAVHTVQMWWGERLLGVISNPNMAFLFLILGFYGVLFEFYSPGWGVAGTLGCICLLLGFFGLAVLPVNLTGLALIAVALGLFVAEAFVTSFGALSLGGVVCLVLGGLMLVDSPAGFMRVSTAVVLPVALATALITVVLVAGVIRAHRGRVRTGAEGLLGTVAVAQTPFSPGTSQYRGTVRAHGEIWNAVSSEPVAQGQSLRVKDRCGLTLVVESPGNHKTSSIASDESGDTPEAAP